MRVNVGDVVYVRDDGHVSTKPRKPHEMPPSGLFLWDQPFGFIAFRNLSEPTGGLDAVWVNVSNGKAEHEVRLFHLAPGEWYLPGGAPFPGDVPAASDDLLDAVEVYLEHAK